MFLPCPRLGCDVELTEERRDHVWLHHPDLIPVFEDRIRITVADPDQVTQSRRNPQAQLFSRWFSDVLGGKHIIVVIGGAHLDQRRWIITAYIARRIPEGIVEWTRS